MKKQKQNTKAAQPQYVLLLEGKKEDRSTFRTRLLSVSIDKLIDRVCELHNYEWDAGSWQEKVKSIIESNGDGCDFISGMKLIRPDGEEETLIENTEDWDEETEEDLDNAAR